MTSGSPKRRVDLELRILDVVFALVFGLLALPLVLLIAAASALTSGLPVLYRGERVGRGGRIFTIVKFRTLKRDAEARLGPYLGEELVRRTQVEYTPVGRRLRASQLDELPQLWNVLRGEMSLVGPRPVIEYEVEQYPEWYLRRFAVKPGLTGLWQVSGRNERTYEEMVRFDIEYAERRSLWMDLRILARTALVVMRRQGVA